MSLKFGIMNVRDGWWFVKYFSSKTVLEVDLGLLGPQQITVHYSFDTDAASGKKSITIDAVMFMNKDFYSEIPERDMEWLHNQLSIELDPSNAEIMRVRF